MDPFLGPVALMTTTKQALGQWGEDTAVDYLINKGYRIIDRNVRTSYGEIDIIAQHGASLVFVEVKTRTTNNYGLPEESITRQKQEHIIASAQAYIQASERFDLNWRIDVIAIRKLDQGATPEIFHFENAIT